MSETDVPSIRDDAWHEHGGEPGWCERLTFAATDTASGTAIIARAEAVPGSRKIDAWLSIIFPEGNLATVLCRGEWPQPADGVRAGRLELDAAPALEAWTLECSDTALVFPTAGAMGLPAKGQRTGAATHVAIDVRFDSTMPAEGKVERETDVNADGFVRVVSAGRFEQAVRLSGRLRAGERELDVAGLGVRERSWGPAIDPGMWVSVAFDDTWAVSARATLRDERTLRSGWVRADGATQRLSGLRLSMDEDAEQTIRAHIEHADGAVDLTGEVLAQIPGREGGMRARRCLVRYTTEDGRSALGFAEVVEA